MSSESVPVAVRVHRSRPGAVEPLDPPGPVSEVAPGRQGAVDEQLERLERDNRRLQIKLHELLADLERMRQHRDADLRLARLEGENLAVRATRPAFEALEQARGQLADLDPQVEAGIAGAIAALEQSLARAGYQRIADRGAVFDPRLHDALACEPNELLEPGQVARVMAPGFRRDEVVVLPARVTVVAERD